MTNVERNAVTEAGIDAVAVKPTESDVSAAAALPFPTVTVDWEGRAHVPDADVLSALSGRVEEVRVTVSVRADGFDPLGDDAGYDRLPAGVKLVLVAGHPAYLSRRERRRAVGPRLQAAVDRARDPWVGTEGVERAARATGAAQFLLLSPTAEDDLRGLRAGGFDGVLAVYAPTVLAGDEDAVLDALGPYVARREAVRSSLPPGASTDRAAAGRSREVLLDACRDYALVGSTRTVADRVRALREAGADRVVGYPARGLGSFGPMG